MAIVASSEKNKVAALVGTRPYIRSYPRCRFSNGQHDSYRHAGDKQRFPFFVSFP
jgi:hypothetical protein